MEQSQMHYAKWMKTVSKVTYVWVIWQFGKRQKYGDGEESSGCQGLGWGWVYLTLKGDLGANRTLLPPDCGGGYRKICIC